MNVFNGLSKRLDEIAEAIPRTGVSTDFRLGTIYGVNLSKVAVSAAASSCETEPSVYTMRTLNPCVVEQDKNENSGGMEELYHEVEQCSENERRRAACEHGYFLSSPHEAYALLKEEHEEIESALASLSSALNECWEAIKRDEPESKLLDRIHTRALLVACEAVQCAGVAQKALDTLDFLEE